VFKFGYNGLMDAKQKGAVRVGPAGWSYDDWKGIVYPAGMGRDRHRLEVLCEWFDTVEVNSSFYHPPSARYCAVWVDKISANPRFKFTAKLWEGFTHKRDVWPGDDGVARFCDGIAPLHEAGKLGAVLVQFPWSFRRTDDARRWLGRVLDAFAAYPLAVEVRHASWDRPEVYAGLTEREVAFCAIDQPLFRDSLEPGDVVTSRVAYVRLHGRNRANWFRKDVGRDARYDYLYNEDELKPWLQKLESIRNRAQEVYAITNNHFRGQAVVNAFELQAGLGKPVPSLPKLLVDEYPRLRGLLSHNEATGPKS
jgi:uncharacterized protein YecE (DUF72 family)